MSPAKTKLMGLPVETTGAPAPADEPPPTVDSPGASPLAAKLDVDDPSETKDWSRGRRAPSASLVGRTVGSYKITRLLGEGGIGAVYLGEHPLVGARVAIKVLHDDFSDSEVMLARFAQEAQAANAISSPHIVRVSDFGELPDGRPYAVMEFLEGQTVDALLTELGTLPWPRAVEIARQVADGMASAHEASILHRDLKPENLFIQPAAQRPSLDGERIAEDRFLIRILDFGIAKLLESRSLASDAAKAKSTAAGEVLGTPLYCSPEQATGKTVTPATDIYALGAVLYELLSGCPTFEGNAVEVLIAKATRDPVPIGHLCPSAPASLCDLVTQMLARDPEARPVSMLEVEERLGALAAAAPSTSPPALTLVSGPVAGTSVMVARGTTPTPKTGRPERTPVAMASDANALAAAPVRPDTTRWLAVAAALALAAALVAFLSRGSSPATDQRAAASDTVVAAAPPTAAPSTAPPEPSAAPSFAPAPSASAKGVDVNTLPDMDGDTKKSSAPARPHRSSASPGKQATPTDTKGKIVNPFD